MLKKQKQLLFFIFLNLTISVGFGQKNESLPIEENKRLDLDQHFFDGTKNKMLGNNDLAELEFSKCVEIYAKHHASLYMLGCICFDKKEISRSIEYLNLAVLYDPNNSWYWDKLIDIYKIINKFDQVAICYDKLTVMHPNDKLMYKNAATFWYVSGNTNKAIKTYLKCEKNLGISEEVSLELERIYLNKKQPEKAIKQLKKLEKSDPTNIKYLGLLADLYLDLGFEMEALTIYQNILTKDPNNGLAHFALADYFYSKKDIVNSHNHTSSGLKDQRVNVSQKISMLQEKTNEVLNNKYSKNYLLEYFDILETLYPEEQEIYLSHANFMIKTGKAVESIPLLEKCLDLGNSSEELLSQLVQYDYKSKNYEKLALHSAIGNELYPQLPFFYYYHSTALTRLGEYNQALEIARQGLEVSIFEPLITSQLLKSLGNAAFQLKKNSLTDSSYQSAYSIDSFDITLCNNYAYYLATVNKDLEKAEFMSNRALNRNPDNANYADTYGWVLFKMGKYEAAEQYLNSAVNKDPDNASFLEHLGDNHWKLGKTAEAIKLWKEASTKQGGSNLLERKIKEQKLVE